MNPLLKSREVKHYLGNSGAKILLAWHDVASDGELGAKAGRVPFQRIVPGEFEGVPTMYSAILGQRDRSQYDVSSLRLCVFGGAALPVEVLRGPEEDFGRIILEGYGLSATWPVASFTHPDHPDKKRKTGSIGTPIEVSRCVSSTSVARCCLRARSARSRSVVTT